jgi:hypothetical protein
LSTTAASSRKAAYIVRNALPPVPPISMKMYALMSAP